MSAAGLDMLEKAKKFFGDDFAKLAENEARILRSSLRAIEAIITAGLASDPAVKAQTEAQAKAILGNLAVVKALPIAEKIGAFIESLGHKAIALLFTKV